MLYGLGEGGWVRRFVWCCCYGLLSYFDSYPVDVVASFA